MEKKKHPAIAVASKADSFRRAGRAFGRTPQVIALADLHPDEHRAIVQDPSLVVVPSAIELTHDQAQALKHHDAPHVVEALTKADTLELAVSEADAKRALALADIEADLTAREARLKESERDLGVRVAACDLRESELSDRELSLTTRSAELDAREAKVADAEKAQAAEKGSAAGRANGKQHGGR